jgi:glycosyltransferase involved in cell wall biosynthesis
MSTHVDSNQLLEHPSITEEESLNPNGSLGEGRVRIPQAAKAKSMRVVVVPSIFPVVSETFIVRHVAGLNAEVFCPEVNTGLLEKLMPQPRVYGMIREYKEPSDPRLWSLFERVSRRLQRVPKRLRWLANSATNPAENFRWTRQEEDGWRKYLKDRKPDVVLAEFAPNAFNVLPQCMRQGIPVVAHFHGYDVSILMRHRSYRRALKGLFKQAAAVVCYCEYMRTILVNAGCPPSKLHIIPSGAPVSEFVPTTRVASQPCRFIAVSRLDPGKGPLVTLKAFHRTWQRIPSSTLTFVGGGSLRDELVAYCRANGLETAVEFTGPIAVDEVRKRMADACVFLQASLTTADGWVEGWGVSIAEALATGLPAVVTRSGGMTDLVIDGLNGFLFEEGDAETMSDRMVLLAENPELRVKMGIAGRAHVEKVGSTEKCIAKLESVLFAAHQEHRAG